MSHTEGDHRRRLAIPDVDISKDSKCNPGCVLLIPSNTTPLVNSFRGFCLKKQKKKRLQWFGPIYSFSSSCCCVLTFGSVPTQPLCIPARLGILVSWGHGVISVAEALFKPVSFILLGTMTWPLDQEREHPVVGKLCAWLGLAWRPAGKGSALPPPPPPSPPLLLSTLCFNLDFQ